MLCSKLFLWCLKMQAECGKAFSTYPNLSKDCYMHRPTQNASGGNYLALLADILHQLKGSKWNCLWHLVCFGLCRISAISSIAGTPFLFSVGGVAPCSKTWFDKGIQRNVRGWQFRKLLEVRRSRLHVVLVLIPLGACFTPEEAVYQSSMVRQANSNTVLNYTYTVYCILAFTRGFVRLQMPGYGGIVCWCNPRNETLMASIKVLHACAGNPQSKHTESKCSRGSLWTTQRIRSYLRYRVSQVIHSCARISTGAFLAMASQACLRNHWGRFFLPSAPSRQSLLACTIQLIQHKPAKRARRCADHHECDLRCATQFLYSKFGD